MRVSTNWAAQARRWLLLLAAVALTGCANMYIDGSTKEVEVAQFRKPDPLHPVQVLFEFQTKGVANARGTEMLKAKVTEQVKASGLFSTVSEGPVPGGALLSLTLNNVVVTDSAYAKGFMTGMTLGLAGTQVTDGYICIARYSGSGEAGELVKEARHAIHTTLGAKGAPPNAAKAANVDEAITTVTRQVFSNVLNDLSHDPAFK